MPRFRFNIFEGAASPTEHWLDLASDAAAIAEARRAARELIQDGGYRTEPRHRIEIRSDQGALLGVVPLRN